MTIDEMLQRAGLRLSAEDREQLARNLAFYMDQLAELRNIPEVRYLEPSVIHVPKRP
jgi:hypothetical protein